MPDRIGQTLGNYRLIGHLGSGGFAEVYLGFHLKLGTQAAIKVLHTYVANEEAHRFLVEARTLAHLDHPNIVRILDFDVQDGMPFIVMNYAPNGTLLQRHPRGTILPLPIISAYTAQIAAALQYAHDQKIIHRDIKPENILLGRHQELLLSDFGIALLAEGSRFQSTQSVVGTASYMAPEQLQGKPHIASDQYALGIVVYEWLSGERPFHGTFLEIYSQHLLVPPPPLAHKNITVTPEIDQVLQIALAKEPTQRFKNINAFATALEQVCTPRHSAPLNQPEPTSYNTILAPPYIDVISFPTPPNTIITGGDTHLAANPLGLQLPVTPAINPPLNPDTLFSPPQPAAATPPPMPYPTYPPPAYPPLIAAPPPPSPGRRSSRRKIIAGLSGLAALALIGGGTILLYRAQQQPPPAQGTRILIYRGHTDIVVAVAWSPDGKLIASSGNDRSVQVWNASDDSAAYIYHGHSNDVTAVAWSPNSQRIASASFDQTVQVWNASNGSAPYTYQGHVPFTVYAVAWSPDGTRIASASYDGTVQVWNASNGGSPYIYKGHADQVVAVTWSPDSKRIASASFDRTVQVWDANDGSSPYVYHGHTSAVSAVAWSPDGTRIASAGKDKTVQVWDANSGASPSIYKGHTGAVYTVAWSPDGTHIASAGFDQTVQVWNARNGKVSYTYHGHTAPVNAVTWSPDGLRIASASNDKTVQVWEV
jgi:eukaryotic-like serine/threonine-protein kinase